MEIKNIHMLMLFITAVASSFFSISLGIYFGIILLISGLINSRGLWLGNIIHIFIIMASMFMGHYSNTIILILFLGLFQIIRPWFENVINAPATDVIVD